MMHSAEGSQSCPGRGDSPQSSQMGHRLWQHTGSDRGPRLEAQGPWEAMPKWRRRQYCHFRAAHAMHTMRTVSQPCIHWGGFVDNCTPTYHPCAFHHSMACLPKSPSPISPEPSASNPRS
mmetsp:Transcript_46488/g.83098  ORF Transcript_46488/g.83098 Transcript_46488/m.83098 type:complete len:120 (+) Transcript_46488:1173-1532(+)